ncbi:acyl-CoA dehydrogenase family protein [Microbulbifer thermotolerans]|uniref:Acyl-CoA dehydrogenase family protein n=1 Tax=Microbulbifer thermotolerans TaxID=252514 RepID=A0AB35HUX4_MICTH|nr:acyl-CoA dehydrogenase family protein [Microbulbifer thermotolerans]MCX2778201.1 acyl-CoA dehydrogenase family protein [Microbulbifer thermotolerans]MCX2782165.1 acyl-CoA dehydrogenase family protein [Microbulbifer thermotolerans]MCX2795257.1 acyl-CoA dehydrogenase family protein [Microbulbifer thermotolerans]MCX2801181.1 acyl-CoA dehydrogenase family protein [Microbulbifer thermotolerans]MCX2804549.1 acyl-CoA dehydrogenase family protein [Microbulbifer thermotolerans]
MIPRTVFNEEHEQFRDTVRKFLEKEALPFHAQWEKDGQVDRGLWKKAGEMGFLCPQVPEEYGGLNLDFGYNAVIDEEISRFNLTGIGWGLHSDIAVPYIINYGSEAQKRKYLPQCISGDMVTAIAMTEPGAGSDLQGVRTTAIKNGDHYVLNGSKTFITNGQHANLVIVVAKTNPGEGASGVSLLLVEADSPGFKKGTNLEKVGMKAQDTSELFFDDVKVPAENLLGAEGQGFIYLMQELPQERLSVAIGATANAEAALSWTVDYVRERKAFGKPVSAFQNTQFKLAELAAELAAMRVFVDRCLELHYAHKLDVATAAKAKLLATDFQCKLLDECVQLHGGYGYMWEYPIARAWADARVQRIYAGTNEIMKLIISRELLQ